MIRILAAALALTVSTAAVAQHLPEAKTTAQPFIFHAGMGDVFEISSSQIALMKSQTPAVRRYASMMIAHHTDTTNGVLAAAKRAGILTPPPPVLDQRHRDLITQLMNAEGTQFDRTYWQQQLQSHEATLALMQGYAANGDTPQLRAAATATIPVVQMHLAEVRRQLAAG